MSIASEIERINTNIANAYIKAGQKGATLPVTQNSANLASTIDSITGGGGTHTGAYQVDSIAEMNEITDMQQGDYCLVNRELPTEYTELDYISSTGTQFINTGVSPTGSSRVKFVASFMASQDSFIFGSRQSGGSGNRLAVGENVPLTSSYFQYGYGHTEWTQTNTRYVVGDLLNVDFIYNNGYQRINVNDTNIKESSFTDDISDLSNVSIYLFGIHFIGRTNDFVGASIKIYSFEIYSGENLIRKFVPAQRKNDYVVGMYDLVNGVFYTNGGSGTFNYQTKSGVPSYATVIYQYDENLGWQIVGSL